MSRSSAGPRRLQLGAEAHRGFPWRATLIWGGLIGFVVLALLRLFVIEIVVVRGNTMAPNLLDGDGFSVLRYAEPKLGDMVLLELDGRAVVRRVVAVAGDRLSTSEGQLVRNDALVETRAQGTFAYVDPPPPSAETGPSRPEPQTQRQRLVSERLDALVRYATLGDHTATARPWALEIPETEVPADCVYVLCDNRRVCEPGPLTGIVPRSAIEGVVGSLWWTGEARLSPSATTPP